MPSDGREDRVRVERNLPIGYLRAAVTLLVVVHHAVIAYHPDAPPFPTAWAEPPLLWAAFPIVDTQRVPAFRVLVAFNDVFFMSLMFFVSGLFVWPSLTRRAAGGFLRARLLRLGAPFVLAAAVLAPLSYYPSYVQSGADSRVAVFWQTWTSLPFWPAGPAWFVWVLLVFDVVAASAYAIAPRFGETLGRLSSGADRRPGAYVGRLIVVSAIAYLAMNAYLGSDAWVAWGPFSVQAGRILHYAVYFCAGIGVGANGREIGVLAADGTLARRWWRWLAAAVLVFLVLGAAFLSALDATFQPLVLWQPLLCTLFAISCAASSFAFVAVAMRFWTRQRPVFDSLGRNAYGIYLTHYVFVVWLQFALLSAPYSGLAKGAIVFATALLLSWATAALLRRIPAVARIV